MYDLFGSDCLYVCVCDQVLSWPGPAAGTLSSGVRPALSALQDTSCPAPPGSDTPASDWPPPDTGPASTNQIRREMISSDDDVFVAVLIFGADWTSAPSMGLFGLF